MITIDQLVTEEIHSKIDLSLNISKFEIVGNKLYLNACDFKWLGLNESIIIDGNEYKVKESDNVNYKFMAINYNSDDPLTFQLKNFSLYEGTRIDVAQVFSQISNLTWEKLPMMWLSFSPLPEISGEVGGTKSFPYDLDFTIYLAGLTDYANRHTKQHMQLVVSYLNDYAYAIVKAIERSPRFASEFRFRFNPLPIFARYDNEGAIVNLLDDTNLSGIKLSINVSTNVACKC